MAAIGAFVEMLLYFALAIGLTGSMLTRLDEQEPPSGASPWRLRTPLLTLWAAPVLFVGSFPVDAINTLTGNVLLLASLVAPIAAFAMVAVEWLRRRRARRLRAAASPRASR